MYLKKVSATYYFFSRVPHDLISLLGKTEVKKSLKTKDKRTAITAAKAIRFSNCPLHPNLQYSRNLFQLHKPDGFNFVQATAYFTNFLGSQ